MGLFSLFKKGAAVKRDGQRTEAAPPNSEAMRQHAQSRQRELARATALKIDAIEAAMTFDIFNTPEPRWSGAPAAAPAPEAAEAPPTLPLGEADAAAPLSEEVALLYASGQSALAAQMLAGALDGAERGLWWMLFDLYQLAGRQEQFDNLSIDYASTFETSPPAWSGAAPPAAAYAGVTPTLALSGALDAGIGAALERLLLAAASKPVLRLDFSGVDAVAPAGSALLLAALRSLQAGQTELILVGAAELATRVRAGLRVGRRDEAAGWLLLLELLQLLQREKDFEETSMDYCITYEVSPPPYIAPAKVATAAPQSAPAGAARFMLPPLIEADCAALLEAIDAHAVQDGALVFDCSRLARVGFGAAGQLLARLRPLAEAGKTIEFRDLNHLVAALLRLLAFGDIARLFAHKY